MACLRMVRPMRRKGSKFARFRQRIPLDVLDKVRGLSLDFPIGEQTVRKRVSARALEINVSLRTDDDSEARKRQATIIGYLENVYWGLRDERLVEITHREAVALAGEFYRRWAEEREGDESITWAQFDAEHRPSRSEAQLPLLNRPALPPTRRASPDEVAEVWGDAVVALGLPGDELADEVRSQAPMANHDLGDEIDRFLLGKGLRLTDGSRAMVIHEVRRAMGDALENRQQNASGDYSPDPKASRFPREWRPKDATTTAVASSGVRVSLTNLVETWRKHPEQEHVAQSTIASYRYTAEALVAFLKKSSSPARHDASLLTQQIIRDFAEHRLNAGIKAKTVRDSDLSCLKALFGFAVAKGMLSSNPAQGITIKVRQGPQKRRKKEFDDVEAQAILTHAWNYRPTDKRESPKLTAAKRWVPWLCAYSGTRVGEMAQLRKQDIKQENGTWIITISHDAATQKRKATWDIPVHPHLVEMAFIEFVRQAGEGHLFLTPRPDRYRSDSPESRTKDERGILGPLQGVKNRLREFVREVVSRPDVQPNHGWRHRFTTVGRECRIEKIVLNAFANHEGADVSDDYGGVTMKTMLEALERMPRYWVA